MQKTPFISEMRDKRSSDSRMGGLPGQFVEYPLNCLGFQSGSLFLQRGNLGIRRCERLRLHPFAFCLRLGETFGAVGCDLLGRQLASSASASALAFSSRAACSAFAWASVRSAACSASLTDVIISWTISSPPIISG